MQLKTDRLLLRPHKLADAEALFANFRTANVGPNAGWKPHETPEETREVLEAMFVGKPGLFAVIRRDTGTLIGNIGFVDDVRRPDTGVKMLGYSIGEAHWGLGFASEAARVVLQHGFGDMGIGIASAYCFPHNARSRRVLEKCGFKHEGRLREAELLWDGRVLDIECFSLTAAEFACIDTTKKV